MREADVTEFTNMLDDVGRLLSRGGYTAHPQSTAMFFRALVSFPIEQVRAGFEAHVLDPVRGRFVPTPADIIAKIAAAAAADADARPGPEEAWAIALRSIDEFASVVWTPEIAEAMTIARPVLDAAGAISGRLAFVEAYARLVAQARRLGVPVSWSASLGFDSQRRTAAVVDALRVGRLQPADAPMLLPDPARGFVPLLENAATAGIPDAARAGLLALRDWLTIGPARQADSQDSISRAQTQRLKHEAAKRVEEFGSAQ